MENTVSTFFFAISFGMDEPDPMECMMICRSVNPISIRWGEGRLCPPYRLVLINQKNPVQTRKKIQLIRYDISNWRIEKSDMGFLSPFHVALTANVYRQTTDKLMFKSVISTVR